MCSSRSCSSCIDSQYNVAMVIGKPTGRGEESGRDTKEIIFSINYQRYDVIYKVTS